MNETGVEPTFGLMVSHKHQNGPKIIYYLEPLCGLRKPNHYLVRESVQIWNQVGGSLLRVDTKLTKLVFRYCDGIVTMRDPGDGLR